MNKIERFFLISLVIMLVMTAFMPQYVVLGDEGSDVLQITFDPTGHVDGNVSPEFYDFSTVGADGSEESTDDFTLYNNGTVILDATGQQNQSTDSGDLDCDDDGSPAQDFYSIQITDGAGVDGNNGYISDLVPSTLDDNLATSTSQTFKLTIHLGTTSVEFGAQTTQINWTFSAAT